MAGSIRTDRHANARLVKAGLVFLLFYLAGFLPAGLACLRLAHQNSVLYNIAFRIAGVVPPVALGASLSARFSGFILLTAAPCTILFVLLCGIPAVWKTILVSPGAQGAASLRHLFYLPANCFVIFIGICLGICVENIGDKRIDFSPSPDAGLISTTPVGNGVVIKTYSVGERALVHGGEFGVAVGCPCFAGVMEIVLLILTLVAMYCGVENALMKRLRKRGIPDPEIKAAFFGEKGAKDSVNECYVVGGLIVIVLVGLWIANPTFLSGIRVIALGPFPSAVRKNPWILGLAQLLLILSCVVLYPIVYHRREKLKREMGIWP